ncbi:type VI secretion system baseplate subunit TssE [Commensalibacter nepenthis]|uniref:Type VI secretion system baseplate subunit TssE n=1 Tax=Commensalibacter nepenthis TaxID=3043872 RepID=A0ABT6Q4F9_9PROT|nr:type VI secretion system baseplate subunit TssE [Commensalibacter sp. TBRC 10068]MDI2111751.1 type VI secretion system baseplate subunit TssE [Commensalibacter sp. TBRC 10068]
MNPSLYEMLTFNFTGELDLDQVNDKDQVILSVMNNIERILNCRAGSLAHLPDYGIPDMHSILQNLPGSAYNLMNIIQRVLLKYEPRLKSVNVDLTAEDKTGCLYYTIEAHLHKVGLVRFGTEFAPEGRILINYLRQRQQID